MGYWNFRLVDMSPENGGDPYIELREVFYSDKDEPIAHSNPCMGSESVDGLKELLEWYALALTKPILKKDDFTGTWED